MTPSVVSTRSWFSLAAPGWNTTFWIPTSSLSLRDKGNPGALISDGVEVDDPICGEHQQLVLPGGTGATVLWNRNYFLRFRFRLLKSFGSGSISDFPKSYGSSSGSYFRKVTVPVPVPAPYLDHKKQKKKKKNFGKYFAFLHRSCFTRKTFINLNKFIVKCEEKNLK
jgi:hypothetical protein